MAELAAHIQPPLANFGGRHHLDHKLMYDTSNIIRHSDQRSSPDTVQASPRQGADGNCGQSTTEEVTNEADDEDSSGGQADEPEDEDDNAEVLAPSQGYGKGKSRRPAIRIESAGGDTSHEDDETSSREAGPSNHLVNHLMNGNKKRTYSNVSNTSLLFGEDDAGLHTFPRPKVARTLSHSGGTGLLAYTAAIDNDANVSEKAIESDDEKDFDIKVDEEQSIDVDDEDYSGLNQISDDEDDIERVEQQEENYIIFDEQHHTPHPNHSWEDFNDARRLSLDSYGSEGIFPLPDEDPCLPTNWTETGADSLLEPKDPSQSTTPIPKRKFSEGSSKRVRFDDEVHMSDSPTSSSSDEMDSALYPDLFLESSMLPPIVHQLMEMDNESDDGYPSNASDQSFWDYVDTGLMASRHVTPHGSDASDESSSEAGSSGYETDLGDTTDEWESDMEMPSAPQTPRPKSVLHRPSSAPASRAATPKPFQRTSAGPPRGVFYHDDDQPIAITDRKTKTLTFYRPRATPSLGPSPLNPLHFATYSSSSSTANNSPRASIQQLNGLDNAATDDIFSNTADIMLSGMVGPTPFAWPFGGTIGPAEAFYPTVYVNANGEYVADDDSYDDDEDIEDDVNLTEFMNFGSDADDTDVDHGNQTDGNQTDVPATPATSTVAFSESISQETPTPRNALVYKHNNANAILEHLDRAGVTAFRNNQNRFRDIACLPHDPNLRASVSRPIRSGRSADALMSPLRKRSSVSKKQARSRATARLAGRSVHRTATFS